MDTKKFEYLETIRETVELGDYDDLKDYIEVIRDAVRKDPDFNEIFMEVNSGRFKTLIPLIDDILFKEMQADFEKIDEEENGEEEEEQSLPDVSDFSFDFEVEEGLEGDIDFEPFDDEGYLEKMEDDSY